MLATLLPLGGLVVALVATVTALVLSTTPGWTALRGASVTAVAIALYCVGDLLLAQPALAAWSDVVNALQLSLLGIYVWNRGRMLPGLSREQPMDAWMRRSGGVLASAGIVALVPGLVFSGPVQARPLRFIDASYFESTLTPFGAGLVLFGAAVVALPLVRALIDVKHHVGDAVTHAVGNAALLVCAVFDALDDVLGQHCISLLPLGYLLQIAALASIVLERFRRHATRVSQLSQSLEHTVALRTEELLLAQAALAKSARLATIGRISAGVAHEINNPIMAVSANLSFVLEGLGDGEVDRQKLREAATDALEATDRIKYIVRQLLDAGRAGPTPEPLTAVCVADAVDAALATARPLLPEGVTLSTQVPPRLFVMAGAQGLVQVLLNLIGNGVRACAPTRGHVQVLARVEGDSVVTEVVDDGEGMAPEVLARVFEPFFTTKPVGEGTGLGLAVSQGLVQHFGGTLTLDSSPGRGTTVRVTLARPLRGRADTGAVAREAARASRPHLL